MWIIFWINVSILNQLVGTCWNLGQLLRSDEGVLLSEQQADRRLLSGVVESLTSLRLH